MLVRRALAHITFPPWHSTIFQLSVAVGYGRKVAKYKENAKTCNDGLFQGLKLLVTHLMQYTLMMASAQVVETSVNTNNSPSQDYPTNPDDHSNHNVVLHGSTEIYQETLVHSQVQIMQNEKNDTFESLSRCFTDRNFSKYIESREHEGTERDTPSPRFVICHSH